jgi:hypothetical protein
MMPERGSHVRARFGDLLLLLLLVVGGTISACHEEYPSHCDDIPVGYPVAALPVINLWWVATSKYPDGGSVDLGDLQYCCSPGVTPGCEAACPPPVVSFYEIGPPYAGEHCVNADFPPGGTWKCYVWATDGGVLLSGASCYD